MPDDVKGIKVRPADATIGEFRDAARRHQRAVLGARSREIIERGVADAVTFPWGSLVLFGIDKVTKYHMEAPLYVTTFACVMNKDKYNGCPTAQKKAVDDNCTT